MAYTILGTVYKIGTTESLPTKNGGTLVKRNLILIQRRFDQNTGEEFEPNYPTLEFTNRNAPKLDHFKPGDKVKVMFDISGFKYTDRQTNEEKYSSNLRGFNIEPYVQPQYQQGYQQPQYQQQAQQQYQQQAQPPFPPVQPQQGYQPQYQQQYNPAQPQQALSPEGKPLPF